MNQKVPLHTMIEKSEYDKIFLYGGGVLNCGITQIIKQLEKKEIVIHIDTEIEIKP